MKKKYLRTGSLICSFLVLLVFLLCCNNLHVSAEKKEPVKATGSISGKAYYRDLDDNTIIQIALDKTDGLHAKSIISVDNGTANGAFADSRAVVAYVDCEKDGTYVFKNLEAGTYTVYANSTDLTQKALSRNVVVEDDKIVTVEDMVLTGTGSISGKIVLDGSEDSNEGFTVFLGGTHYSAITGRDGKFCISGIPAIEKEYDLHIEKGTYSFFWKTVKINSFTDIDVGQKDFSTEEIKQNSLFTDGADGKDGVDGKDGKNGTDGKDGINGKDGTDGKNGKDGTDGAKGEKGDTGAKGDKGDKGADGKDGKDGKDGTSIIWKGVFASSDEIENPKYLWAFFNSTDGCSYIYDGQNWTLLAKAGAQADNLVLVEFKTAYGSAPASIFKEKNSEIDVDELPVFSDTASYYFGGWLKDGNEITTDTILLTESVVFTAKWEPYKTVTFVINSSTMETIPTKPAITGLKAGDVLTSAQLEAPQVRGNEFDRWYTTPSFSSEFNAQTPVTQSITLYAKYNPEKYRIIYVIYDYAYNLPDNAPEWHYFGTDTLLPDSTSFSYWHYENSDDEINMINRFEIDDDVTVVRYCPYSEIQGMICNGYYCYCNDGRFDAELGICVVNQDMLCTESVLGEDGYFCNYYGEKEDWSVCAAGDVLDTDTNTCGECVSGETRCDGNNLLGCVHGVWESLEFCGTGGCGDDENNPGQHACVD